MRRFARSVVFFLASVSSGLAVAAGAPPEAPPPAEWHRAQNAAMLHDDAATVAAMARGETPAELAAAWEAHRERAAIEPNPLLSEAEFVRAWSMLATPEGTEALVDEILPHFAGYAESQKLRMNHDLPGALARIGANPKLAAHEAQQMSQLVLAMQRWTNGVDWSDRARLARAIGELSGFVRRSGVATPGELELLPFDEVVALGEDAMATAKRMMLAYDYDLDATLASNDFEEITRDGDRATLSTRGVMFGLPLAATLHVAWRDGRWVELDDEEAGHDADATGVLAPPATE